MSQSTDMASDEILSDSVLESSAVSDEQRFSGIFATRRIDYGNMILKEVGRTLEEKTAY